MSRILSVLTIVLVFSLDSRAQSPADKPISLSLRPAALPQPSLKYRLLPDERDLQPGNAAGLYYRAEALFVENQALLREIQNEKWDTWASTTIQNLPLAEVRESVKMTHRIVVELEHAAVRKDCDWMLEGRSEGLALLLPEVQTFRRIAIVLAVRARLEIAEGQFDRATKTLQTGYALAQRMGEGPTIIHYMVGVAIASTLNSQLQAFVEQTGAPNLYWAIAALPRPFFDPKRAVLQEPTMLERTFPWLARLDKGPMTREEIDTSMLQLADLMDEFGVVRPTPKMAAATALLFAQGHPAARQSLIKKGMKVEDVNKMSEFQIVSLDGYKEYREAWEEGLKWIHIPEALHDANYKKAAERVKLAMERMDQLFFRGLLKGLTAPQDPLALDMLYTVRYRQERRMAALRCVEAIRLYAASHTGTWPTQLKDLTEVSVPMDPVTGKEFVFKVADGKATLESPKSDGKSLPVPELSFELSLLKQ
ncbi:MAG TPA: hypothetical protein VG122_15335 [Gemmata sp.]|jgi:hypothetical protein|nr:hypothetical protein [Gemmata sp.]